MQKSHLVHQRMSLCWDHIWFTFTLNLGKKTWSQGICLAITNLLLISSNAPLKANIQCKELGFMDNEQERNMSSFLKRVYECVCHM